ncbi:MAG: hypothetical protein K0S39_4270 [Paenibacillus sp.]|jgi:hypothetical protein|nr:hypothetical protein [Paenibacillus sp.]
MGFMQYEDLKSCETCEFLIEGICTNRNGKHGRGWRPGDTDRENVCWSISLDYFSEIISELPDYEQQFVRFNDHITVNDLLHRIEAGYWKPAVLKKAGRAELDKQSVFTPMYLNAYL